ncbi:MAG: DUF302 domain-containing protein [Thermoplasmatota archaeon]
MTYHFTKELDADFDEAIEKVTLELKKEGFGVLTDIDVKATLKKKIDVDFRKYRILGACNPPFAYKAMSEEPNIGLMLPCNVVVQELEEGKVRVSAIDPVASMMAVKNDRLGEVALQVQEKIKKVIDSL